MALSHPLCNRLVRYDELRPCTNAFIDARSPGSDRKENFTIIGPGVAENPHQYVHINIPHGFNIGAARQPPGCTNSLHSHDTAEVFIIHTGRWRFFWGEHGDAGEVFLVPGDTISIPTAVFRGFENVGEDTGFMFAVLGGDDPGRVHWAPHVIEKARGYGLVLLESGRLIDTTNGETVPPGASVVAPSSREDIAYIRTPSDAEMRSRVARRGELYAPARNGVSDIAVIGLDKAAIATPHEFRVRLLAFDAGASTSLDAAASAQVLLLHRGRLLWENDAGESVDLNPGDTFTIPAGMACALKAEGAAEVYVVDGGVAG